ncbi:hypothetical protein J2R99_001338 [Rhodopseudomonas julia]|uniref:Secreted protein n=1 Tax=Rhodopseudomonas julia TaxID=200617 RepID=A0ABU0C4Q7_9BRAD|nr:hypothetical protein [Rhodopseudomonas julia]MDQ0325489.1 hypothetical protein [Rhodopseudomonas julia]
MRKVLTCVSATAAFLLLASAASADCSFHRQQVMASKAPAEEKVAMATTPVTLPQVVGSDERNAAPKKDCAAGDTACTGGTK